MGTEKTVRTVTLASCLPSLHGAGFKVFLREKAHGSPNGFDLPMGIASMPWKLGQRIVPRISHRLRAALCASRFTEQFQNLCTVTLEGG